MATKGLMYAYKEAIAVGNTFVEYIKATKAITEPNSTKKAIMPHTFKEISEKAKVD